MSKNLFRTPPPGMNLQGERVLTPEEEERILDAELNQLQNQVDLPFLYGWKWYPWALDFYESMNKINLLCAANQISKSSTQIRKCLNWATDKELWPVLWPETHARGGQPIQFWYLYPTQKQVDAEYETKWKLFLPKNDMKDDDYYGWTQEKDGKHLSAIHFKSGVHVYFKTYSQALEALQTGTCDAIFCDEELPVNIFDELMLRISASDGYFHMVFTATHGQEQWRRAMEPTEKEKQMGQDEGGEFLPTAFKQTVSLYDAQFYTDGTPSHWTLERIKQVESRCSTHNEVLKRVHGRFIVDSEDRKYPSFDLKRHFKPKHPVPKDWLIYAGADIGGGGLRARAHKSALCYVAVRPDYRAGRVFLGWRGDKITTTAGDVVMKHIEIKDKNKLSFTGKWYDWGNKDFGEIAVRMGEPFEKAEKSHEIGEDVINTLFKNDMMYIYDDPELAKLGAELAALKKAGRKQDAMDDFADAFRYAITKIPWDWTFIKGDKPEDEETPEKPMNDMQRQVAERRKAFDQEGENERQRIEDEFSEWNDAYEGR